MKIVNFDCHYRQVTKSFLLVNCSWMGVICCVSFSNESFNPSLLGGREGKQVGAECLVRETNELWPSRSIQSP